MWKKAESKPQMCFIGCPHLSFAQLNDWTKKIGNGLRDNDKTKVAIRTILSASPDVVEKFKKTDAYENLYAAGGRLTSICPLMYTNNPLTRKRNIATNSNKLRTYSAARYYKDDELLNIIIGKEGK